MKHYKKLHHLVLTAFLSFLLIGCGGSGGGGGTTPTSPTPTELTAYFIDSGVKGVDYTCGSLSGTTGNSGAFTYTSACGTVAFKIGDLTLGTIASSNINSDGFVTVPEIAGTTRTDIDNPTAIKIATLLQSLDDNNNTSDGIEIKDINITTTQTISNISSQDINNTIINHGKTVRTETEVKAHMEDILIEKKIIDTTPNSFSFNSNNNVGLSSNITSNLITISGINYATAISISNGEYSINNSGTWTDQNGTITNGQTIQVRHTSSASFNTNTTTSLTIGGVNGTFTSTTILESAIPDTTPDNFTFTSQENVSKSTLTTSNSIQISGLNSAASVSISTGSEYSIDSGAWTSSAGTITNGQTIQVRHTSSASFNTNTITSLTIGGVNGTFTSTTLLEDTTPNSFSFNSQSLIELSTSISSNIITITGLNSSANVSISNGEYSINNSGTWTDQNGTITNGQTIQVRHTSSASFNTNTTTTLTIGGVNGTFTSITETLDTTPNTFSFSSLNDVNLSTDINSSTIQITGINYEVNISITNGFYKINNGDWINTDGNISNDDNITLKHTSSSDFETNTTTSVTIGGINATFISTTRSKDNTPDTLSFTSQTNLEKDTLITSNELTITGIDNDVNLSISNGSEYSKNNSDWYTEDTTINNNESIWVRHTSSSNFDTNVTTILTVGTSNINFISQTRIADTIPDALIFNTQSGVSIDTEITSNTVTLTGIEAGVTISVDNGYYKINDGSWTSVSSTIVNDDNITVKHTSNSNFETNTTTTITINDTNATFTSTAEVMDDIPDTFSFESQTDVNQNTLITSNTVTISGINTNISISISGGEYSINGGTYTDQNGTIANDDNLTLRHTSAYTQSTETNTTITLGIDNNTSKTFTSITNNAYSIAYIADGIGIEGIDTDNSTSTSDGSFTYNYGDTITFKLGTLIFGSFDSTNINETDQTITLQEIVGLDRTKITSDTLVKIAVLLYSLDEDKDNTNGISIANDISVNLDGNISDFTMDEIKTEIKRLERFPVDEFDAMNQMLNNLQDNGILINDVVTYPRNGATNVGTYAIVKIGFGKAMAAMNDNNLHVRLNSTNQVISLDYNDTLEILTLNLTNQLTENTSYEILLDNNEIQDTQGNKLSLYSATFTTGLNNDIPKLKTGTSTNSYDNIGSTPSGTIKDDGYLSTTIGVDRDITKSEDIVTDDGTGLLWYNSAINVARDWNTTNTYCQDLNISGNSDWRVPSLTEMSLIASKGEYNTSIFSGFTTAPEAGGSNDYYWLSNRNIQDDRFSYAFSFLEGADKGSTADNNTSGSSLYAQCVQGDVVKPQFVRYDAKDVVLDTTSGLMWQDNATASAVWYDESHDIFDICENLSLGGYIDWRVPNYNELLSLVEMDDFDLLIGETNIYPAYINKAFKNFEADNYWSSTTYVNNKTQAWGINFGVTGDPISTINDKTDPKSLRCVRTYK